MKHITGPVFKTKSGLYFEPGRFYLDPVRKVDQGIVTHAHFDHFCNSILNVYATPGTCALIDMRTHGFAGTLHAHNFREPFMLNGVQVTFFPAGHVLGSAMVLLEHRGVRYLYTGDFKTAADPTCEGFEGTEADVLICESTYANPAHEHPEDDALAMTAGTYRDANVIIGAYVLGKAQRLTELLCRKYPERSVMIHPEIVPYHHFYEHRDIFLGQWENYDYSAFKESTSTFFIVPPKVLSTFSKTGKFHVLLASSYSGHFPNTQLLNLSDHADWKGFQQLIAAVKPKSIITTHGDGLVLKESFSELEFFHC
jgi:putative mRNA 3-end processing factor